MYCGQCGAFCGNQPGRYCPSCGAEVGQGANRPRDSGVPATQGPHHQPAPVGDPYRYSPSPHQSQQPPRRPRSRITLIGSIVAVLVVVIAVAGYLLMHKSTSSVNAGSVAPAATTPTFSIEPPSSAANNPTTTTPETPSTPASPIDPYGFTSQAGPQQDPCLPNSTGQVAAFLTLHGCDTLTRSLYTATIQNQAALVSVERISGLDTASVPTFIALITGDGTGDIRTLLASGTTVAGYPTAFVDQSTFLAVDGPVPGQVVVLKAMWRDSVNTAGDALLMQALVAAESLP